MINKGNPLPNWVHLMSQLIGIVGGILAIIGFFSVSKEIVEVDNKLVFFLNAATVFVSVSILCVILLLFGLNKALKVNADLKNKEIELERCEKATERLQLNLDEIAEENIMCNLNTGGTDNLTKEVLKIQYKLYNGIFKVLNLKLKAQDSGDEYLEQLLRYDKKIRNGYEINVERAIKQIETIISSLTQNADFSVCIARNTKRSSDLNRVEFEIVKMSEESWDVRESLHENRVFMSNDIDPVEQLLLTYDPTEPYVVINNIEKFEKEKGRPYKNNLNEQWRKHYSAVLVYPLFDNRNISKIPEGILWIDCKQVNTFDERIISTLLPVARLCRAIVYGINQWHERVLDDGKTRSK
ncbi:MAG: hypothetical protein AAF600_02540 [Bacteroidota bacterium]